jgi:Reverse transcriptase (RNA-dependent DNA polymerase)
MSLRRSAPLMRDAIRKEITGLISRCTFKLVMLPDTARKNSVPSRFVLAIKHEDGREVYKARLCLGGHRDFLKHKMVHTATTLSQTSTRLILAMAAIFDFDVWTTDFQQAYLQSAESLQKEIFLMTNALELGLNEFLQLVLPLYGLSESGDYWGETLTAHHLTGIQFEQSAIDLSLFFKRIGRRLVGLSGTYVDGLLRAAHPEVREFLEDTIRKDFDCNESKSITTGRPAQTLLELDIIRTNDGFFASMQKYIRRLAELAPTASFERYRRLRTQLLWACVPVR